MRIAVAGLLTTAALLCGACGDPRPPEVASRRVVRLVADTTTSQPLAAEYAQSLPHLEIKLIDAVGTAGTVSAILRGDADLGFVLADVAYFANQAVAADSGPSASGLRGMAALQTAPVHVLTRHGKTIRQLARSPAPRVGTNAAFSSQSILAGLIFTAYGLGAASLNQQPLTFDQLADRLTDGAIDAAFVTAYYPAQSVYAVTTRGAELLSIDQNLTDDLRRKYPFIRRVTIPARTYPGQHTAVRTIGVDRLLVCRSDLDQSLVYELTREFVQALPRIFATVRASARMMDLDQASATPIPLHKGAAQYYREWELTP